MKPNYLLRSLIFCMCLTAVFTGCKKDEDDDNNDYTVPTTYVFTDANGNNTVDFSGQTKRLNQLSEMITYVKTGNTVGTTLNAQNLRDMYANTGGNGGGNFSFTSDKQLKDKTFAADQALIESYFDSIAVASTATAAGGPGVAGVVFNGDGTKKYLLSASGIQYGEWIEKVIMGATFYYQATDGYLGDDKMSVDNTTAVDAANGKYYTQLEHHWDEAFGYFTDSVDFPTHGKSRFWGKYSEARNSVLGTNAAIMNAFLTGRAAITNKDLTKRDEMITIIRTNWEKVAVGTAINYFKQAKTNFADDAVRNHVLSEGTGMVMALKYNPEKVITNAQITQVLNTIGNNFYDVTTADIDSAIDQLVTIYGLESVESQL